MCLFCSSDEVETEDLGEVHERENASEFHTPSPVIPSSLLVQQVLTLTVCETMPLTVDINFRS